MRRRFSCRFAWIAALLAPVGCEVDYLAHLVIGELDQLSQTVPIEDAFSNSSLSEEERAKLELVGLVRRFGIEQLGMADGPAFTVFHANGAEPAAYVLSASEKDSLTPFQWLLPVVGLVEYKGFFDRSFGQREADRLAAEGFDVLYAAVGGFSTLGVFPDPIRQSNLQRDNIDLAEFVLHEMMHATVFKASDTDFNEAMATFVGRTAAQAWFDATDTPGSAEADAARLRFADKAVIDDYVLTLFAEMSRYYGDSAAAGMSRDDIISGRAPVFQGLIARFESDFMPRLSDPERWSFLANVPVDNARILAGVQYQGGLSDFADVLEKTGGSFPDTLGVYAEAARQPDSREYLREWAAAR